MDELLLTDRKIKSLIKGILNKKLRQLYILNRKNNVSRINILDGKMDIWNYEVDL